MKLTLNQYVAIFFITLSTSVFASQQKALDTPAKALKAQKLLEPAFFAMHGANGIGITGCHPKTGRPDLTGNFVHCVSMGAGDEEAEEAMLKLFPNGTKIGEVFIVVELTGSYEIQPRATVGN